MSDDTKFGLYLIGGMALAALFGFFVVGPLMVWLAT